MASIRLGDDTLERNVKHTQDDKIDDEAPISSYHKSENSNICANCGYYGCTGNECDIVAKDHKRGKMGSLPIK